MTLSESTKAVIKSTAPVLAEHGAKITSRMYKTMFVKYPQTKNLFNMSHQSRSNSDGTFSPQEKALANAIHAYAANIDNLSVLAEAIDVIVNKHVSFDIVAEHYKYVGECLIRAIKDELQLDDSSDIIKAWEEGYWFLADLLIKAEENMKVEKEKMKGGWRGFKTMVVWKKEKESDKITSFYLKNEDGSPLPDYKPGQYLSFRIPGSEVNHDHDVVRNYTLSGSIGNESYRISVKKEDEGNPAGVLSNYFHNKVNIGSKIQVGMPSGCFVWDPKSDKPIVLIAGGVGITPLICMLERILGSPDFKKSVTLIHSVRTFEAFPMKGQIEDLLAAHPKKFKAHVFFTRESKVREGLKKIKGHCCGRLNSKSIKKVLEDAPESCEFYYCGPAGFMKTISDSLTELHVPNKQMKSEVFGPAA